MHRLYILGFSICIVFTRTLLLGWYNKMNLHILAMCHMDVNEQFWSWSITVIVLSKFFYSIVVDEIQKVYTVKELKSLLEPGSSLSTEEAGSGEAVYGIVYSFISSLNIDESTSLVALSRWYETSHILCYTWLSCAIVCTCVYL